MGIIRGRVLYEEIQYSSVPNRRVGLNERAGGKILRKHYVNVQDGIDVQGENFLENE